MRADLVIAGAGCAGLSLAVQIALQARRRGRRCPRVVLVEPRTRYVRDRTWCYWRFADHPFSPAVSHRWTRWLVRANSRTVVRGSARHPYEHLPADGFYAMSQEILAGCPEIELRLGCEVLAIAERGDEVEVTTSTGTLRTPLLCDSRPPAPTRPKAGEEVDLLQHFVGWEVEAPRAVFDPETAVLMDFAVIQARGLHFMYVLPFSPTRALVESTYISPVPLAGNCYEDDLRDYLRRRYVLAADEVAVTRCEQGAIPMTTRPAQTRRGPRVIHLGIRGGLARGATGYAFQAIQRFSAALAAELLARPGAPPRLPAPYSAAAVAMDRVLLAHLQREPSRGPPLLFGLFEKVPPEVLCRFLSDHAGPLDYPRVMLATPMAEMTAAVLRSRRLWLRPIHGEAE